MQKHLKKDKVLGNLCKLLEIFAKKDFKERIYPEATEYYSQMCLELYNSDKSASLPNYLYDLIYIPYFLKYPIDFYQSYQTFQVQVPK